MNRGAEGRSIFPDDKSKEYFLRLLVKKRKKLKIRLFAYCIMDNHYHLILQNSSGRLSDFVRAFFLIEAVWHYILTDYLRHIHKDRQGK